MMVLEDDFPFQIQVVGWGFGFDEKFGGHSQVEKCWLGAFGQKQFRFNSVPVESGSRYFNETVLKLKPWEVQNQTKSGL